MYYFFFFFMRLWNLFFVWSKSTANKVLLCGSVSQVGLAETGELSFHGGGSGTSLSLYIF